MHFGITSKKQWLLKGHLNFRVFQSDSSSRTLSIGCFNQKLSPFSLHRKSSQTQCVIEIVSTSGSRKSASLTGFNFTSTTGAWSLNDRRARPKFRLFALSSGRHTPVSLRLVYTQSERFKCTVRVCGPGVQCRCPVYTVDSTVRVLGAQCAIQNATRFSRTSAPVNRAIHLKITIALLIGEFVTNRF